MGVQCREQQTLRRSCSGAFWWVSAPPTHLLLLLPRPQHSGLCGQTMPSASLSLSLRWPILLCLPVYLLPTPNQPFPLHPVPLYLLWAGSFHSCSQMLGLLINGLPDLVLASLVLDIFPQKKINLVFLFICIMEKFLLYHCSLSITLLAEVL